MPRFGKHCDDGVVQRSWLGLVQRDRQYPGDRCPLGHRLHRHVFCGPLCPQAAKRSAAPMGTGSTRPKGVVAARIARIEMDDDEFHRRLM